MNILKVLIHIAILLLKKDETDFHIPSQQQQNFRISYCTIESFWVFSSLKFLSFIFLCLHDIKYFSCIMFGSSFGFSIYS